MRCIRIVVSSVLLFAVSPTLGDDRIPSQLPADPAGDVREVLTNSPEAGRSDAPRAARATPVATSSAAKRRHIEAVLQSPLEFPTGNRKTVTLAEFAEHVRTAHGISIRLDLPTLSAMLGATSSGASGGCATLPPSLPAYYPPDTSPSYVRTYSEPPESRLAPPAASPRSVAPSGSSAAGPADGGNGWTSGAKVVPATTALATRLPAPVTPAVAEVPALEHPHVWLSDYPAAMMESKRRGAPMALLFCAKWCGPCRKLESEVLNDPKIVGTLKREVVAVRIDVDQNAELVKQYNTTSVPAIVLVGADGAELSRIVGYVGKSDLANRLDAAIHKESANDEKPAAPPATSIGDACPVTPLKEGAAEVREIDVCPSSQILEIPVPASALGLEGASVGSALRQMLEALSSVAQSDSGLNAELPLPIRISRAADFDYLVQSDGVLVTTRLEANVRKETRVYRVPRLPDCSSEELARLITRTIRPWSWRSQATDLAEGLASKWTGGFRLPGISIDLTNGVKVAPGAAKTRPSIHQPGVVVPAGAQAPPHVGESDPSAVESAANTLSAEMLNALGQFAIHGAATLYQGGLAVLEIAHHGDPPTGVIEALPTVLVITQSQGAHQEIADLLEQLSAESEGGLRSTNEPPPSRPAPLPATPGAAAKPRPGALAKPRDSDL